MNLADTGNTQKTDKVYNFLQYAKLTCVGDLWTQALRSFSQSPRGNLGSTSLADVIWYIAGRFSGSRTTRPVDNSARGQLGP